MKSFLLSLLALIVITGCSDHKERSRKQEKVLTHADSIAAIKKDSIKRAKAIEDSTYWANYQKDWAKNNPKAAKLKKKHPKWTNGDCMDIANHKIWVGMSYEMLVELRGLPDSANPSNYGKKTHWQWCWYDYTPSCFYDDNDDGIIDSYN